MKNNKIKCEFGFTTCDNYKYGFCDTCEEGSNYETYEENNKNDIEEKIEVNNT